MLTPKVLPNIIFVDGVPSKRLGGISQTLYNLFDDYPSTNLFAIVNKFQKLEIDDNSLICQQIALEEISISTFKRKIITQLNPLIQKLNAIKRDILGLSINEKQLPKNALLIVCTSSIDKLHVAQVLYKKYGFELLTYFMDDWTNGLKFNWGTGNIDELVKYTLDKAVGRLMISEMLNQSLINKYQLTSKPTYVVHNPVGIEHNFIKPESIANQSTIKIVYAGSIWRMHLDALVLLAKAVRILNKQKPDSFELVIYSKPEFWNMNKTSLEGNGIFYNGFLEYSQLHAHLSLATLLVVTSSFLKIYEPFSRSSVQTKITDYMKEGKPILSIGPSYGACNWFVNKWQCGYVFKETRVNELAQFLLRISLDDEAYQINALNAYKVVKTNFSKPIVQNELYAFIGSL